MSEIKLGDKVEDMITGFTGIAIAREEGLFTPVTFKVQKRGEPGENSWSDAVWLEEARLRRTGKSVCFADDECKITEQELHEARKTQS